jgi:hypothetical protein
LYHKEIKNAIVFLFIFYFFIKSYKKSILTLIKERFFTNE